ncbi:alpha amylase, catalytic domain protein, partial [Vibrio parahaemolyticus VP2007-007]
AQIRSMESDSMSRLGT